MKKRYWAVKPEGREDAIRLQHCETPQEAVALAFGRVFRLNIPNYNPYKGWFAKDLGTRVSVIQSDRKRVAVLRDSVGWFEVPDDGKPISRGIT